MKTPARLLAARTGLGIGMMVATWFGLSVGQVVASTAQAPKAAPAAAKPAPRPKPIAVAAPRTKTEPAAYVVRRVLDIPTPFRHGDAYWDESGAPATGAIVVTVDLKAQTLSVFRDGYEIGTAVVLYGADAKPTPTGVFAVTEKDADHVSNLYDAPMPFMLRLTNDGVSIHGSKIMSAEYATHGCVGVPTSFAKKLFGVVKLGDKVIVSNGERLAIGKAITAA